MTTHGKSCFPLSSSPCVVGIVGIDTIKASVSVPSPLSRTSFNRITTYRSRDTTFDKWIWNPEPNQSAPRVTFYPKDLLLQIEVSLPHLLSCQNVEPVNELSALDHIDRFLTRFGELPGVRLWKAKRIDYFATWDVCEYVDAYIHTVSDVSLGGRYRRRTFEHKGISWQTSGRRVNFYSKSAELGLDGGLLRLEVQNTAALRYMSGAWVGKGAWAGVGDLVSRDVAGQVLSRFIGMLGLDKPIVGVEDDVAYLNVLFGKRWPYALAVREMQRLYGQDAARSGLLPASTFYKYKRLLKEKMFSKQALSALSVTVVDQAKNLEVIRDSTLGHSI